MTDTLQVVRGAAETTLAAKNRSRMGLLPHTEAFEDFIANQHKRNLDLNRPMIGNATSRYHPWPNLDP